MNLNPFKKPEVELDGRTLHDPMSLADGFKLVVIVGHERKAPGATLHKNQGSIPEYLYNTGVANEMKRYARSKNVNVEIIFRDGIGISGANKKAAAAKPDACIELHFNSFNTQAHGTETLCTPDSQDVAFAKLVQGHMCRAFDRTGSSRGIKVIPRGSRGGGNVHGLPGIANCLVEPFFGDNPTESAMAAGRRDLYAQSLVNAFIEWTQKS